MSRRRTRNISLPESADDDDDDDQQPLSKLVKLKEKPSTNNDSSSDSDIESYLQPADKIDLNSSFFNLSKHSSSPSFNEIENNIFSGVTRLTDTSESENEENKLEQKDVPSLPSTSDAFAQHQEYIKKIDEVKRYVERYESQRKKKSKTVNVGSLLALGERKSADADVPQHESIIDSNSDSDDWEEIADKKESKNVLPALKDVEITVEMPGAVRKKKGIDLMAAIKRRINRVKKENQILIHKVHLLCWIAHGNYVSSTLNCEDVLGMALSLLPSQQCYPPNRVDLTYLEQILKWFGKTVILVEKENFIESGLSLSRALQKQIVKKEVYYKEMLVYIFIAIMRALGIQCRVILSLQVESLRPSNNELLSLSTKSSSTVSKKVNNLNKNDDSKIKETVTTQKTTNKSKGKKQSKATKETGKNSNNNNSPSKVKTRSQLKRKSRDPKNIVSQLDGTDDTDEPRKINLAKLKRKPVPKVVETRSKRTQQSSKTRDSDSEDEFEKKIKNATRTSKLNLKALKSQKKSACDVRGDIVDIVKRSIKQQRDLEKSKTVKRTMKDEEEDSDYVEEEEKRKHQDSEDEFSQKHKVKKRVSTRKQIEEEEVKKKKKGVNVWAEVYLETEEKWISVDVIKGKVHCVNELYTRATHPVSYVVAWNNDNTIKDITKRYCTNFNTVTRKLRIDNNWWLKTLTSFAGRKTIRDKEEDEELDRQQLEQPLPTSIAEYKNHPLYVLKRHLLKFEAIYPSDAPPLGFVKNEPVYARECVYVLHSRDLWLKQARVVKPGEKPYKIVKARPKWDKLSNSVITDQLLEIFGLWQTQDYEPPTAENGVVPRNAFGNVEMFKPCMLPKKTVHLKLPGLNKVAKKLNIDCAPALVGFDFHAGWNHPTYDGFIVCEEFADVLVAAWDVDQEEQEKREQEKIEKRVYGNWKRLIRGLFIRERLKVKYNFGEPSSKEDTKKKRSKEKKK